jgi:hypothetical protein
VGIVAASSGMSAPSSPPFTKSGPRPPPIFSFL